MKIAIRGRQINKLVKMLCTRRLSFALDRFAQKVGEIVVTLRDVNGPKGGCDKTCQIVLRLIPRGIVVVKGVGTSFAGAVDTAIERASASLHKQASKTKWRRRARRASWSNISPPVDEMC